MARPNARDLPPTRAKKIRVLEFCPDPPDFSCISSKTICELFQDSDSAEKFLFIFPEDICDKEREKTLNSEIVISFKPCSAICHWFSDLWVN